MSLLHLIFIATSYLLASIPSGILFARLFNLQDPREFGSGNIGASNMTRLGGRKLGALTLLGDSAKGLVPCLVARFYFEDHVLLAVTAAVCVFAHCYSIYLGFRGGKGVATAVGILLVLSPIPTLVGILAWVLSFTIGRITSASAFFALLAIYIAMAIVQASVPVILSAIVIGLIIIRKHETNLLALLNNQERSF